MSGAPQTVMKDWRCPECGTKNPSNAESCESERCNYERYLNMFVQEFELETVQEIKIGDELSLVTNPENMAEGKPKRPDLRTYIVVEKEISRVNNEGLSEIPGKLQATLTLAEKEQWEEAVEATEK